MLTLFRCTGLALLACLTFSSSSSGQVIFEMSVDNFAEAGGFTFSAFGDGGFEIENDYFTLDVSDFGGAGVATSFEDDFPNFTNAEAFLEVEVRLGENNEASDFRIVLADTDGLASNDGRIIEDYQYFVSLDGVGTDEFSVVSINLNDIIFNQTSFGAEDDDDGLINYGLVQVQIQSAFDSLLRTDVDIRRVSLVMGQAPVVGDFSGDGVVDLTDVDFYNGNIGQLAAFNPALDLDGNGTIEFADLEQHVETLVQTSNGVVGTAVGDINLDGQVNVLGDALILVGSLATSVTSWGEGDLNADQTVSVLGDALLLVGSLGASNDAAAAP